MIHLGRWNCHRGNQPLSHALISYLNVRCREHVLHNLRRFCHLQQQASHGGRIEDVTDGWRRPPTSTLAPRTAHEMAETSETSKAATATAASGSQLLRRAHEDDVVVLLGQTDAQRRADGLRAGESDPIFVTDELLRETLVKMAESMDYNFWITTRMFRLKLAPHAVIRLLKIRNQCFATLLSRYHPIERLSTNPPPILRREWHNRNVRQVALKTKRRGGL